MRRVLVPAVAVVGLLAIAPESHSAPSTFAICDGGSGLRNKVRPVNCAFTVRGKDPETSANRILVRSTKWRHWGSANAYGSGTLVANMGFRQKVTVRLYSRAFCEGGYWYNRAKITYRDKRLNAEIKPRSFSLPHCGET